MSTSTKLKGSCHCGAVHLEIPGPPPFLLNCNCSLCRRLGGLWGYFPVGAVQVTGHPEHTDGYIWGDKTLRTVRCRHCGCVTHWEPLTVTPEAKMGVNIRMFAPEQIGDVRIRRFDGAESWSFID
ncbi:MAG: GFA family protein [Pseudomonadota bacterium]